MAKHYLRELQHIYNLKILSQYLGKDEYELQNLLYRKTYSSFLIPRKNGKHRSINAPSDELKYVLQNLNRFLSAIYNEMQGQEHPAHGFTLGKGILSNAKIHSGKAFVLNLDLKDFFPSISRNRIKEVFSSEPFMLKTEIADYLSELVTYYDTLPQGSPASPIISNLVCWNLDKTLSDFAKKNLLVYTRYADDLSFSSNQKIDTEIIKQIEDYIQKEGFQLNTDKTRIQNRTERQVVTGVTVNVKPNVSRKFIRRIRAILHSWETLGYEEADTIFQSSYKRRKGVFKAPSLKYYLIGNIAYIGHIRGQDDSIYNNFCIKLFRLSDRKVFKGQIERFIQSLQSDIDNQQFSETNLENRIFNLAKKAFEPHQIRYNNILRKYYTLRKKTKINITKGKNYSSLFLASLETSPEFKELLYESGRFGDKEYYSQYIKEAKRLIRNTNLINSQLKQKLYSLLFYKIWNPFLKDFETFSGSHPVYSEKFKKSFELLRNEIKIEGNFDEYFESHFNEKLFFSYAKKPLKTFLNISYSPSLAEATFFVNRSALEGFLASLLKNLISYEKAFQKQIGELKISYATSQNRHIIYLHFPSFPSSRSSKEYLKVLTKNGLFSNCLKYSEQEFDWLISGKFSDGYKYIKSNKNFTHGDLEMCYAREGGFCHSLIFHE